jgi:nucleoside-diphosphate-sugar epimerase
MFNSGERILVTGGAGFIGKHLVNALTQRNCHVTVVDRAVGYSTTQVQYICADIKEFVITPASVDNYDIVFHLAGNSHPLPSVNDPLMDYTMNLDLSIHLLEAIRKSQKPIRLINVSSAAIYGNPEKLPISECDKPAPLSPYGVSKLAVENYVNVYSGLYNVYGISVRPFSVYGPGLYKQVVYDLIRKLINNPEKLDVYGNGTQVRDFIYIDDLVNAMVLVAEKGISGEVYNIASGTSYSINEIVDAISSAMSIQPEINYSGKVRSGEPDKWIVNIEKIQKLGFSNKINLHEGIGKTVNWVRTVTM